MASYPIFWAHNGVLYVRKLFVAQRKWMYDVEISRKLKSRTKTIDEIQVSGRGVVLHCFLSDAPLFFVTLGFFFAGGSSGGRKPQYLSVGDIVCWYRPHC